MDYSMNDQYWIWLCSVARLRPQAFYGLIAAAGDAHAIWDDPRVIRSRVDEKTYAAISQGRDQRIFFRIFAALEKQGITAITRNDPLYPERLIDIVDPPPTLFIKGNPDLNAARPLAVVGTRNASYEGRKTAREFTQMLSQHGVSIVSGLARGIDTCAHASCLSSGGHTIAVLGSGVNQIYPPENAELAQQIVEAGGSLVSELHPDDTPQKWTFPARNRIISGLSQAVLIVEGKRSSGALITADYALDQSRDIFAVPGSIYSPMSEGTNWLIQTGAFSALSAWDILETERWGCRPDKPGREKQRPEMNEDEQKIYEKLIIEPLTFDEIANSTGYSAQVLNSHLTMMVLRGIIITAPGNIYRVA